MDLGSTQPLLNAVSEAETTPNHRRHKSLSEIRPRNMQIITEFETLVLTGNSLKQQCPNFDRTAKPGAKKHPSLTANSRRRCKASKSSSNVKLTSKQRSKSVSLCKTAGITACVVQNKPNLIQLNSLDIDLVKQSMYRNTVAEQIVKEDERKRVSARRAEYASQQRKSKTQGATNQQNEAPQLSSNELKILDGIREKTAVLTVRRAPKSKRRKKKKVLKKSLAQTFSKPVICERYSPVRVDGGPQKLSFKQTMLQKPSVDLNPLSVRWDYSQLGLGVAKQFKPSAEAREQIVDLREQSEIVQIPGQDLRSESNLSVSHCGPRSEIEEIECEDLNILKQSPQSQHQLADSLEIREPCQEFFIRKQEETNSVFNFTPSSAEMIPLEDKSSQSQASTDLRARRLIELLKQEDVVKGLRFLGVFSEYFESLI